MASASDLTARLESLETLVEMYLDRLRDQERRLAKLEQDQSQAWGRSDG